MIIAGGLCGFHRCVFASAHNWKASNDTRCTGNRKSFHLVLEPFAMVIRRSGRSQNSKMQMIFEQNDIHQSKDRRLGASMRFETWKIIITSVKKTKHNEKKERGLLAVF